MFSVMPVICMITSAASRDRGMLTAATSVERRLARNRKIVRTANSAPVPPSRSRPSRDSLMNEDRSDTTVTVTRSECCAPSSLSFAVTASATCTVLAVEVLVTDSESDGWPPSSGVAVRAKPVVGTPTTATVPRSPMVMGLGATGVTGVTGADDGLAPGWPDAVGCPEAAGCAGVPAPGTAGAATPTTMLLISSMLPMTPIVDTGVFVPSPWTWPDGMVTLLAVRTPTTCASETFALASFAGSSVTAICCSSPPLTSTLATPSMASSAGSISVWTIRAASLRPSGVVAATDAMITGDELMFRAATVGSTDGGRFAASTFCWISACVSFTFVPTANCAMTRASELADVDWTVTRRGTPEIACSMGLVTWSATSAAPAPGSGAITVMTGSSMSGRSSCLRLPQAAIPAMNSAAARRSVTLRLATAISERRLMRVPFGWTVGSRRTPGRPRGRGSRGCCG